MRLAILTCGMLPIPAVQGGAVENLIDFYLEYNDREKLHDITIYSPWDDKIMQHSALSSAVNHYHFIDVTSIKSRLERRLYKYLHSGEYYNYFIEYYFEKAYTDIKKKKFDYIIIENGAGLAYKLSQRGYNNLILHLHNDLLNSKTRYNKEISRSLVSVFTVSNYIKKRVSTIVPKDFIKTIYNGIDLENFSYLRKSSITREKLGFSKDDFIIIYSGRINKEKGVSELIDAMLMIRERPRIKLMIIGGTFFGNTNKEDEYIHSIKEKAKVIEKQIVFTGFISYDKMPDYLKLADISVIPSIWDDPFPTTELEAQAMGLPIITTLRGGIPEEVSKDNAILLETDDKLSNNIATSIIELYDNPEKRQQMSKESIERAKLFDKKKFAENFFKAIEDIQ